MSELKLHIVSFSIPDPPDYGGIIDVFYKIKYLSEAGVKIYLHCSQYGGRQPSEKLESLCEKVWYYPRHTGIGGISPSLPYTVFSRRSDALLANLQGVNAPILFDGLTTAYYLSHPSLSTRTKILRPQNVEQDYYRLLAERTRHPLKRIYYGLEASLIGRYEDRLGSADAFFTVAQHDHDFFRRKYPNAVHEYIPSFQPYNDVSGLEGNGSYCLYHGNLAVEENEEAVLFLLEKVIPYTDLSFVIAGKQPSENVIQAAKKLVHCKIVADPDAGTMGDLIANAHIHVLPTFQNTGLKLKLLHALFHGRHVLVNDAMLEGTGLDSVCHVAATTEDLVQKIKELVKVPFTKEIISKRKELLLQHYDNHKNVQRIITYLQRRSP